MNTGKKLKHAILESPFTIRLVYVLLNLYAKTVRVRIEEKEIISDHLTAGGRVVLCCWHQRFFGGFYLPRMLKRPLAIMISQSSDGALVSGVVEHIGWITVRGSSSRGGREALREMIRNMKRYAIGGHIADGPTGPPRVIKSGIVFLARLSQAAICPTYVYYRNPWIFNSWDRFMVPKPFSSVCLRFGSLVFVPEHASADDIEAVRIHIEKKMCDEYERREGTRA